VSRLHTNIITCASETTKTVITNSNTPDEGYHLSFLSRSEPLQVEVETWPETHLPLLLLAAASDYTHTPSTNSNAQSFSLPFSELSLVELALDVVD